MEREQTGNSRLINESALNLAMRILSTVRHLFREEEQHDALGKFYEASREELETYERRAERMRQRLRGGPMGDNDQGYYCW